MRLRFVAALCAIPLLAACGASASGGGKVQSASGAKRPTAGGVRQPVRRPPPPPALVQRLPGLEGVIGATAADLSRQFGPARLDVWEGDARKLQFTGSPCVLDIYLYPNAEGREPHATYVDARRTDGRETDRAACVAALRKR